MAGIEKKAVCTAINGAGSFQGDDGLVYKYEVEFQNGDAGLYFSPKTPEQIDLLKVGQEAEYNIETKYNKKGEEWNKITPRKPKPAEGQGGGWKGGGGGYRKTKEELAHDDLMIARQSSLKVAAELITKDPVGFKPSQLILIAEHLADWVVSKRPAALLPDTFAVPTRPPVPAAPAKPYNPDQPKTLAEYEARPKDNNEYVGAWPPNPAPAPKEEEGDDLHF